MPPSEYDPPAPAPSVLPPSSLPASHPSPRALALGYAGLAPFVIGAILVWLVNADAHPHALTMLAMYAATIVSFLGGIHWGLALRADAAATLADGAAQADTRLLWGVVPPLVAWVAAVMPAYAGLIVQGGMLIACYLIDRRAYPRWGAAAWLTLRFRLTVVASLSCFLGAAAS